MFWKIIGLLAVILTAFQFIPQVLKAFKTKKTEDISMLSFVVIIVTVIIWILHGIHRDDYAVITANIFVLISAIMILILKIKYNGK